MFYINYSLQMKRENNEKTGRITGEMFTTLINTLLHILEVETLGQCISVHLKCISIPKFQFATTAWSYFILQSENPKINPLIWI